MGISIGRRGEERRGEEREERREKERRGEEKKKRREKKRRNGSKTRYVVCEEWYSLCKESQGWC